MEPTPQIPFYFHDLAQNRGLEAVVMLREPAGEMDRKIGFTDSTHLQKTLIFPRLRDKQKIHEIHFYAAIAYPVSKK